MLESQTLTDDPPISRVNVPDIRGQCSFVWVSEKVGEPEVDEKSALIFYKR